MTEAMMSPLNRIAITDYIDERDREMVGSILLDERTWSKGFGDSSARIPVDIDDAVSLAEERAEGVSRMYAIYIVEGDNGLGELIGTTALVSEDAEHESVKMGRTLLHPDVWGRGVNYEVKVTLLDYLFSPEGGVGRVECDVAPMNVNSMRSLESMGFLFEGVRRRASRRPDGTWRDTAIFSTIREEWEMKRPNILLRAVKGAERPIKSA